MYANNNTWGVSEIIKKVIDKEPPPVKWQCHHIYLLVKVELLELKSPIELLYDDRIVSSKFDKRNPLREKRLED